MSSLPTSVIKGGPNSGQGGADLLEPIRSEYLGRLKAKPYGQDLFMTLRRLECLYTDLPRFGEAVRVKDEPIQIAQEASLTFAPSPITQIARSYDQRPVIVQRVFGLLGPNGPLPNHLTEHARDRLNHFSDPTFLQFTNLLSHRFAMQFYRAWAQAQPVLSYDRASDQRYVRWLGSLFGIGSEGLMNRDGLPDEVKLYFTGRLARSVRDADGLKAWLSSFFQVPVGIQQWCGHWMALDENERTRLAAGSRSLAQLGRNAVLGNAVWDVQHKFRVILGRLALRDYLDFLPGSLALLRLRAMVRQYIGFELEWDLQLVLRKDDVPRLQLGKSDTPGIGGLGHTSWLQGASRRQDAGDLIMNLESDYHKRMLDRLLVS